MRKLLYILIPILLFSCRSTKEFTEKDTKVKTERQERIEQEIEIPWNVIENMLILKGYEVPEPMSYDTTATEENVRQKQNLKSSVDTTASITIKTTTEAQESTVTDIKEETTTEKEGVTKPFNFNYIWLIIGIVVVIGVIALLKWFRIL